MFVVKPDQTVEMRPVTVARASASETVLASGVQPGDTVVTDGTCGSSRKPHQRQGDDAPAGESGQPQDDRKGAP